MIHRRHLPALIPAISMALAPGARAANGRDAPGTPLRGTAAFGGRICVCPASAPMGPNWRFEVRKISGSS